MPDTYPEPEPFLYGTDPRLWAGRCRVVIPCFNLEQAERIAERVAEFCSCDLERLICITNNDATKVFSETVVERIPYLLTEPAAAEDLVAAEVEESFSA